MDRTPIPTNPKLADRVFVAFQKGLADHFPWLDHAFGRAQRLSEVHDGKDRFYPGVHISKGNYVNVFPDDQLGNFSFFTVEDPQTVDFRPGVQNNIRCKYSLILWANLDTIFENTGDRNTEALKSDVLEFISRKLFLPYGRADVRVIYEQAENIYRGYNIREIDSQFLMQPYAGFRFEGELAFTEEC